MMIRSLLCLLILASCNAPALAKPSPGPFRVKIVRVIDVDTFLTNRAVFGKPQKIRMRGINGPEITQAQCAKEKRAGLAGRAALQSLADAAGG